MNAELSDVIKYKHEDVVRRFIVEHPEAKDDAEKIFEDLMRFFWISKKHDIEKQLQPDNASLNFVFIMDDEMKLIDQMWHVFLLWTKDYMDYCEDYFGIYLHHLPNIVPGMPQDSVAFEENLRKFLSYTYDKLGEEVVRRWFSEQ